MNDLQSDIVQCYTMIIFKAGFSVLKVNISSDCRSCRRKYINLYKIKLYFLRQEQVMLFFFLCYFLTSCKIMFISYVYFISPLLSLGVIFLLLE